MLVQADQSQVPPSQHLCLWVVNKYKLNTTNHTNLGFWMVWH